MKNKIPFLRVFLAAFLLIVISACQEKPAKLDYGPQVSPEEILKARYQPVSNTDPITDVKAGQYVHYMEKQVLQGTLEYIMSDVGLTVVNRTEDTSKVDLTLIENRVTYGTNNESKKMSTEFNVTLAKTAASVASLLSSVTQTFLPIRTFSYEASDEEQTTKTTYHNLAIRNALEDPPASVQQQTNCLGIQNCKIRVYHITYDQIDWESANKTRRIQWEYSISADVPYLSQVMNKCMTLLIPVDATKPDESQRVLVRYCLPVVDFRFQCDSTTDPNCTTASSTP